MMFVVFILLGSAAMSFALSSEWSRVGLKPSPPSLPQKVIVVGSTGRLGRQVVSELLESGSNVTDVTALCRDMKKAKEVLPSSTKSTKLKLVECDLNKGNALTKVLQDQQPDAAIWCAAGFTDNPSTSPVGKLIGALKLKFFPTKTLDITALDELGRHFAAVSSASPASATPPKVVMCSSAGVTRPLWSEEKKRKFVGAADIPIVRLNPLNILGVKRQSEQALRKSGCSYTVLRPCGLNDKHPDGSRPILSQGDVAVGRICRKDVATLMIALLKEPGSVGKTFEAFAIPGLPVPKSFKKQLSTLEMDDMGLLDEEIDVPVGAEVPVSDTDLNADAKLEATYALLQQLVPGDVLQPNELAMGQTYEQQSVGEEGRLGKRGTEVAPIEAET